SISLPLPWARQNGMLGRCYIIRNVKKPTPRSGKLACYERHKSVNVVIEFESADLSVDSRRIVKLAVMAADSPVQTIQRPF
ncbi:hypothetical protein GY45DRAFT_1251273, partial [Cubamyces sp. BRFM 1775]